MADPVDPPEPEVGGVFGRPFTEQVAYFRRKLGNLVPTERWDDMLGAAHDHGFMVAGAAKADLLTDLGAAVDKAISEGRGIEAFRKDFRDIVRRNGWTGWTGEGSVKGEAWRVGVILKTNASTSYAAGRRAQLIEGGFPLWVYRHGGSQEPRPEHLSWDGIALPPDHPFWTTHYPPCDWGCSCYVLGARSAAGVRRLGGDPDKGLPAGWDKIDRRTGAPVGIGRGWDYAPGASKTVSGEQVSQLITAMAGKVRDWDFVTTKAFMAELPQASADAIGVAYRELPSTADDVRRYAQRVLDPPPGPVQPLPPVRTLGVIPSGQVDEIAAAVSADVAGFDFVIDEVLTRHIMNRHGPGSAEANKLSAADFALLPQILNRPDSLSAAEASRLGNLKRVMIRKIVGDREYETVWEIRGGRRSLYLKSFYVVRRVRS